MTDAEREAQIRQSKRNVLTGAFGQHVWGQLEFLLRLLDESPAYAEQMQRERNEAYAKFHEAEREIARLKDTLASKERMIAWLIQRTAPPGASAMARAERTVAEWDDLNPLYTMTELVASAIEQAEREVRAAAFEEVRKIIDEISAEGSAVDPNELNWINACAAIDSRVRALVAKPQG
jgi:hypothetical protein